MGRVFAYEDHNGWPDCMFLTDHELSDNERFCPVCELWSEMIGEVTSREMLIKILSEHGITKDDEYMADTYDNLVSVYEEYSAVDYKAAAIPKEELEVGVFFLINGNFTFSGCAIKEAETYGDFLIYPESHLDVWNKFETLGFIGKELKADYDYFPRGRVVYRKSDDTFIIYYDRCIEEEIHRIANEYKDYKYICTLDEHYCCQKCNDKYQL